MPLWLNAGSPDDAGPNHSIERDRTRNRAVIAGLVLYGLASLPGGQARAQTVTEDLDRLDARVAATVAADPVYAGWAPRPVDRRLRLVACPHPASIGAPLAGAVAIRCDAAGWRIRVALIAPAGASAVTTSAIHAAGIEGPPVIRRGDVIELSVAGSGYSVITQATAQSDAATGAAVRVKSPTSGQILSAVATGPGSAEINE